MIYIKPDMHVYICKYLYTHIICKIAGIKPYSTIPNRVFRFYEACGYAPFHVGTDGKDGCRKHS